MDYTITTLKKREDFLKCAGALKWVAPHFVLQARKWDSSQTINDSVRIGLVVSKKVGGAVVRNRAKRRLKETLRQILKEQKLSQLDIVLIARSGAVTCPYNELGKDLLWALKRLKLI